PQSDQMMRLARVWAAYAAASRCAGSSGLGFYPWSLTILERMSAANPASFSEPRLISTFAKAPLIAAWASAEATVRSEAIFGFVIGPREDTISATSHAFCAVSNGTVVAPLRAESIRASPSDEALACLYAAMTRL